MPTLEEIAKLNRPSPEPVKIEYKRWRHKQRGYIVQVFQVLNFRGKHGFHTVVVAEEKGKRQITWPARTFLRLFEPLGRRMKIRSRWDRIDQG